MKHYTDTIPLHLAEKLKEKGYNEPCSRYYHTHYDNDEDNAASLESTGDLEPHFLNSLNENRVAAPMYREVFDWLMEEEIYITIERNILDPAHYHGEVFRFTRFETLANGDTWHEAADAAIEKALTLI